jgi:hypothetical protein
MLRHLCFLDRQIPSAALDIWQARKKLSVPVSQ